MKIKGSLFTLAFGFLGTALLGLGFASTTRAADESSGRESITLSPVSKRYQVDAGSAQIDELTIVNDGNVDYDFIVYARPYSVKNESYEADFTAQKANADAYQWVQFDQPRYSLKAGETIKVKYTVRVPQNASPGGHYGVLFAETQPAQGDGNSVVRKKRVGSLLYATVNGEYKLSGKYESTSIPFWQTRPPISASSTVSNSGNSDFLTSVNYKITDIFGRLKFNEQKEYPVLPQTTRQIPLVWSDAPWFGLFKAEVTTKLLDKPATTTSGYVLIIPKWLSILTAVIVIGGVGYAILRRR